jgi:hypothetical protein
LEFGGEKVQSVITIEGKILGRKKPMVTGWAIPFPFDPRDSRKSPTLRELITQVVLEEVNAFQERQEQQHLTRMLTEAEIVLGVEKGKVDMGGRNFEQEVDPQVAVDTALQAFEDSFYYVFVDGEQQQELDRDVSLRPNSQVTFVRLVPLAGG